MDAGSAGCVSYQGILRLLDEGSPRPDREHKILGSQDRNRTADGPARHAVLLLEVRLTRQHVRDLPGCDRCNRQGTRLTPASPYSRTSVRRASRQRTGTWWPWGTSGIGLRPGDRASQAPATADNPTSPPASC